MPVYTLNPSVLAASASGWVATGGSGHAASLADASDSTYVRSGTPLQLVLATADPTTPSGTLVSIAPGIRAKKAGGRVCKAEVVWFNGSAHTGCVISVPTVAAATDYELAAHRGVVDFSPWGSPSAREALISILDYDTSANRAYVYKSWLKAYYLLPATIAAPSAPTGTVIATQTPLCTAQVSVVVESWQVPAGELSWLTGGDVEFRIYRAADVGSATTPPVAATPAWSGFQRFVEATYGDGTTPTAQTVSLTPDEPLENDSYVVYARASRDLPTATQANWSAWARGTFTLAFVAPAAPTALVAEAELNDQRMHVTCTVAATTGFDSGTLLVDAERSDDAGLTWSAVRGILRAAFAPGAADLGYDYEAPRDVAIRYRARVSMLSTTDGLRYFSVWASVTTWGPSLLGSGWNLKVPEDPTLNWLDVLVDDDPQEARAEELSVLRPLDRRLPVVVAGPLGGLDGSLTICVLDYSDEVLLSGGRSPSVLLAGIESWQGALYLETGFGDAKYIRLTSRSNTRAGTRTAQRREVQLEYVEINRPPVAAEE